MSDTTQEIPRLDHDEIRDWLDSLDAVIDRHGLTATGRLLQELTRRAEHAGVQLPFTANTPYLNTVPRTEEPAYPGDRDLEHRLKSLIRWNALAMVVRANRHADGIGGHISTYASAATLYEVGFSNLSNPQSCPTNSLSRWVQIMCKFFIQDFQGICSQGLSNKHTVVLLVL